MKVIVAGYAKTGTKSLAAALRILGYKVYDVLENATYLQKEWTAILRKGWTTEDFQRMYENVDAVTDIPACSFWEEIHKAFPDAKIILMLRDEDDWFRSFETQIRSNENNTMMNILPYLSPTFRNVMKTTGDLMGSLIFGMVGDSSLGLFKSPIHLNKEYLKLRYRAHNAYVLKNAPPEKLLLYKCAEGWDPLCEFLDVPVPEEEFPHKNKSGQHFKQEMSTDPFIIKVQREAMVSVAVLTAALAFSVYFVYARGPVGAVNSIGNAVKSLGDLTGLKWFYG